MKTGLAVGLVVFVATFVTNVVVVAVWPDNEVDWAASVIVAATTAVVLTFVFRRSGIEH
ncbi:MAG: hypothetical protein OEQ47_16005 [Acidimicrobiia bacterium]|nr:hypothetical protein [Acidimicrobiia bacterium]